ncbi:MAG: FG-GAP-like repeat-containing protein [Armatimonadota bacterium]
MRTLRLGVATFLVRTLLQLSAAVCVLLFACGSSIGQNASASTIFSTGKYSTVLANIKRLPDGAYVYLNQKIVSCITSDIFYIEEPDRSAGIKVVMSSGHYVPATLKRGNLVTFSGHMSTRNNERVIIAEGDPEVDYSSSVMIHPIGMNTAAIMGWPVKYKEPFGPRMTGLVPNGLYIRLWGKTTQGSTYDENANVFCYIDDGWGKFDGSDINAAGIRIYTNNTLDVGQTMCANGVLSTKLCDPDSNVTNDEFYIPCVLTTEDADLAPPDSSSTTPSYAPVTGRVRLVGEQTGRSVRVYSENNSIILNNVTDQWTPFTLRNIPSGGTNVCAGANGYKSATRVVNIGDTGVDFELQPSDAYTEILSDKDSIAICSEDTALVCALRRDCEGKGLEGKQVRLTTTRGIFTESNSTEFIGTTDSTGCFYAHLSAGSDGRGTATLRAETYPSADQSSETSIELVGPIVSVSASPNVIDTAGSSTITAHVELNDAVLPNVPLTFMTDKGHFEENSSQSYTVLADGSGIATANLMITEPGTAKILVKYENNCSYTAIDWSVVALADQPWYDEPIKQSHPLVVDLDGDVDGKKEVVTLTGEGYLAALKADGNLIWSKGPFRTDSSNYGNTSPSCSPMDSERSGRPCIFLPTETPKAIYAYSYNGNPIAGWPTYARYSFFDMACSIGDINLDGSPEFVCGDQSCYVWSWNPTGNWTATTDTDAPCLWLNLTSNGNTVIHSSTCALGDMDNDEKGILDVVVGTVTSPGNLFGFPGDAWGNFSSSGYYLDNWPKTGGGQIETAPAIGDIDGDGKNDVAWGAGDGNLHILLSSTNSQLLINISKAAKSSPALADLDGDGKLDVIIGSDTGNVYAFNYLGQALQGWEGGVCLDPEGNHPINAPVSVGDVTGDGQPDVVAVCEDGFAYAIYADGRNHANNTGPIAWAGCCIKSSTASLKAYSAPVIDDIDNDGLVEILVAGSQGIYLFQTNASYSSNASLYPWPTFHRDNRRSGCATSVPAPVNASIQGIISHNGIPIPEAKIYIYKNNGSSVYVPYSSPSVARSYVLSVGSTDTNAVGVGAYCISQLEPNQTYKIKVVTTNYAIKWVTDIAATTGLVRVDVEL